MLVGISFANAIYSHCSPLTSQVVGRLWASGHPLDELKERLHASSANAGFIRARLGGGAGSAGPGTAYISHPTSRFPLLNARPRR